MEQTRQGKAGRKPHKKRVKADTYDFGLFFVVLTLVLFGVVMIFSASYYETMSSKEYGYDMFYYLKRQGMWAVVGTVGMIVAMNVPYQLWKKFSLMLYWISNGLLAILPFVGKNVKGQTRWIGKSGSDFGTSCAAHCNDKLLISPFAAYGWCNDSVCCQPQNLVLCGRHWRTGALCGSYGHFATVPLSFDPYHHMAGPLV